MASKMAVAQFLTTAVPLRCRLLRRLYVLPSRQHQKRVAEDLKADDIVEASSAAGQADEIGGTALIPSH